MQVYQQKTVNIILQPEHNFRKLITVYGLHLDAHTTMHITPCLLQVQSWRGMHGRCSEGRVFVHRCRHAVCNVESEFCTVPLRWKRSVVSQCAMYVNATISYMNVMITLVITWCTWTSVYTDWTAFRWFHGDRWSSFSIIRLFLSILTCTYIHIIYIYIYIPVIVRNS